MTEVTGLRPSSVKVAGQPVTATIVTLSVFGATGMYILSMLSLFRLRRTEPDLERPFRAPLYPALPAVALTLACGVMAALIWFNPQVFGLFVGLLALGMAYYAAVARPRLARTPSLNTAGD